MATHDFPVTDSNDISGTPSAGNYARWADADTLEARTTAQVLSDIGAQASDTDLTAIAALTSAADKVPYATGAGTWALADLTAAGRALLDDADAAAQRATLGVPNLTGTPVAGQVAVWSDEDTLQGLQRYVGVVANASDYTNGTLLTLPFLASGGAADGSYVVRVVRKVRANSNLYVWQFSFLIASNAVSGTPVVTSVSTASPVTNLRVAISGGAVCLWGSGIGASDYYLEVFTNVTTAAGSFGISDVASTGTAATVAQYFGTALISGNLLATASSSVFCTNSSDGSDNKELHVNGGGSNSDARGGGLYTYGNEHATVPGGAKLYAGNVSGGYVDIGTQALSRIKVNYDGTLTFHATTLADLRDQVIRTGYYAVAWTATPATGYLNADGSAVSRATYAALFAVIGTTFGVGDGSTTFNLPDASGLNANDIYLHIKT